MAKTHKEIRLAALAYNKEKFGSTKNACATTASLHLKEAKVLKKVFAGTIDLYEALIKLEHEFIIRIDKLQAGDIAFSCDLANKIGYPDHVYLINSVKGRTAQVYDNYSNNLKERNLGKGPKTSFAFAIRLPNMKQYIEELS